MNAAGRQYAYLSEWVTGNIDVYAIDEKTGALKSLGVTVKSGTEPQPVTIDSTGKFAYVANAGSNNVFAYSIDAATGALTPVTGSPFAAGKEPDGATTDPKGKFAYVANYGSNNVSAYTVDGSSGSLTPVAGSPFAISGAASTYWIGVAPKGKFAYVAYADTKGGGNVAAFTINASSGALKRVAGSPFATGSNPGWMTLDPNDKFVYVTNEGSTNISGNISAFAIGEKSGALTPVPKSPFSAGEVPYSVITDPTGKFLYEGNLDSFTVSAYTIGSTGGLKPVKGSPFATGLEPESIAVDATGSFVYVANFGSLSQGNIFAYRINKVNGALTKVPGSPFARGNAYSGVAICKSVGSACKPPLPL